MHAYILNSEIDQCQIYDSFISLLKYESMYKHQLSMYRKNTINNVLIEFKASTILYFMKTKWPKCVNIIWIWPYCRKLPFSGILSTPSVILFPLHISTFPLISLIPRWAIKMILGHISKAENRQMICKTWQGDID